MKYVDEFRAAEPVRKLADALARITTRPHTIMEVCGGQTHAIVKYGLDTLLPEGVELIHGPGCPVCVTPAEIIDHAVDLARRPEIIFCSFGDMMRVPGNRGDLLQAKAAGGDVRMVYSPLDAVKIARDNPDREVVFFAVGFETTAPAHAMAVLQADKLGVTNFSLLISHVLVPPALEAIINAPGNRVQGFLAAGHVCAIMGSREYEPVARRHRVPIVITGFEPVDILHGVYLCVKQLEEGRAELENQYTRAVRAEGNAAAQAAVRQVFRVVDQPWRGLGSIADSGLGLQPEYARFDAMARFPLQPVTHTDHDSPCISGAVLTGQKKPHDCPAFGKACTPENPLGAPMVSTEGACAAYFRYRGVA